MMTMWKRAADLLGHVRDRGGEPRRWIFRIEAWHALLSQRKPDEPVAMDAARDVFTAERTLLGIPVEVVVKDVPNRWGLECREQNGDIVFTTDQHGGAIFRKN